MMLNYAFHNIYKNKTVLLTGHTGFKGSWLSLWLSKLGARVVGLSLEPSTHPNHFTVANLQELVENHRVDIRDSNAVRQIILTTKPDFVFHLAAQAIVRRSYTDPLETFQTNTSGTLNLLEGLRLLKNPCAAVIITSDKCYDNVEWVWGYRETDRLGGPDPYSASKGAAELIVRSYIESFFPRDGNIRVGVGRSGNVIGGGDWAADRIVPDCIRSWSQHKSIDMRYPYATRPWQHVMEPLSGYLTLAEALHNSSELHGEPFNFGPPAGPDHTVLELVERLSSNWNDAQWDISSTNEDESREARLLKLACDKALHHLRWRTVLTFSETVDMTSEWYATYYKNGENICGVTEQQISQYSKFALERDLLWAQPQQREI